MLTTVSRLLDCWLSVELSGSTGTELSRLGGGGEGVDYYVPSAGLLAVCRAQREYRHRAESAGRREGVLTTFPVCWTARY